MKTGARSTLHLQLGQEVIYLLMGLAVCAALYFAALLKRDTADQRDPPIILMREADGFFFQAGSALLSPKFEKKLRDNVIPQVEKTGRKYRASVIEVIGHTDEVPLRLSRRAETNLDRSLSPFLLGTADREPIAADNVGLGMARAVSVARVLRASPLAASFQIMPLSAGPFQKNDDTAALGTDTPADMRQRRRIEIRLRRQGRIS
jgi:flagellar motor protein MotB